MEVWDLFTRDGEPLGKTHIRGERLPKDAYHIVCECLVRHVDGSYLVMQRSRTKSVFAGMPEATAGGAAQAGESPLDCITRELREETGISADSFDFVAFEVQELGQCVVYSYFCTVDTDKSAVTLQEGETDGYEWLDEEEFIELVNSGRMIPTQRKRFDAFYRRLGYVK